MISKDVSRHLEKRFGKFQAIGHVGTLDPMAEGVLPILLGKATRLQDLLLEIPKQYRFVFELGFETDTLDLEGKILKHLPVPPISLSEIQIKASQYVGDITQTAPRFSAIKIKGLPAHRIMRTSNVNIPEAALKRQVTILALNVSHYSPPKTVTMEITCSKGTYVRSIARDIAYEFNTCATVTRLIRTHAAGFDRSNSIDLDTILLNESPLEKFVISVNDINLPIVKTGGRLSTELLKNGSEIDVEEQSSENCSKDVVLKDSVEGVFGIGQYIRKGEKVYLRMKRSLV